MEFVLLLFIFVLAAFLGLELIQKVPSQLHTPLMSGSNAISGITIVGALIAAGTFDNPLGKWLGFAALVLLTAMALTSTNGIRRRMRRNWDRLHTSAYAVGILAVWHYWWQVKQDILEPLIYAVILAVLLGSRLFWRYRKAVRN